jgi:hypothetical protein
MKDMEEGIFFYNLTALVMICNFLQIAGSSVCPSENMANGKRSRICRGGQSIYSKRKQLYNEITWLAAIVGIGMIIGASLK